MNTPNKYTPEALKRHDVTVEIEGFWVLGRPMGLQGLFLWRRVKLAWDVFRGRADVLYWTGQ